MTWAILAVMSLLLSWSHQTVLSPKMDKALTTMENIYQKQWVSPMTTGCKNTDTSIEKESAILVYSCKKDTEFFVYLDLTKFRRYRIWNVNNSLLSPKTK